MKICETIQTVIWSNYSNTRILLGVPKNLNTEYQILFGIEKIRIPNTNITIWSNYSNTIRIPNYSSHPVHCSSALSVCPQSILFSPLSSVLMRFRTPIRSTLNKSLLGKLSIYGVHPRRALVTEKFCCTKEYSLMQLFSAGPEFTGKKTVLFCSTE